MRSVFCPSLQREVSALGFGCAQLGGSRVSEACGRRAFDKAYDLGVTWYDTAPSYGDGKSEAILGKFLVGRRDRVVICTKFGIPRSNIPSLLRPAARMAVRALSPLRAPVRKIQAARVRELFKAELIEASLAESLRNLRTDYLDVLALHEPSPLDCANDEILTVLHRVVEKGYVRLVSIAGPLASIAAGVNKSALYGVAQLADNPFEQMLHSLREEISKDLGLFFITHSVFGRGALVRLRSLLATDNGELAPLTSQLGYRSPTMASELLLDYALAKN